MTLEKVASSCACAALEIKTKSAAVNEEIAVRVKIKDSDSEEPVAVDLSMLFTDAEGRPDAYRLVRLVGFRSNDVSVVPQKPILAIYPNKGIATTEFMVANHFGEEWSDVRIESPPGTQAKISVMRQDGITKYGCWRVKAELGNVAVLPETLTLTCRAYGPDKKERRSREIPLRSDVRRRLSVKPTYLYLVGDDGTLTGETFIVVAKSEPVPSETDFKVEFADAEAGLFDWKLEKLGSRIYKIGVTASKDFSDKKELTISVGNYGSVRVPVFTQSKSGG